MYYKEGSGAGYYQKGYEGYGRFLRAIGEADHQSCLILTSREKPVDFSHMVNKATGHVHKIRLSGLNVQAAQLLLSDKTLSGSPEDWRNLVEQFSGNPLHLRLAGDMIATMYSHDITAFLRKEQSSFGDIGLVLEDQFARLSPLEQELLICLALDREALPASVLARSLAHPVGQSDVEEALWSLWRRSLLEITQGNHFYITGLIKRYLGRRFLSSDPLRHPNLNNEQTEAYAREHPSLRLPFAENLFSANRLKEKASEGSPTAWREPAW
jgi:hypothetical protein